MKQSQPIANRQILCPGGEELSALLRGELSDESQEQIVAHVATCKACETELRQLEAASGSSQVPSWRQLVDRKRNSDPTEAAPRLDKPIGEDPHDSEEDTISLVQQRPAIPAQIGPYQIQRSIGKGGMGHVYRAIHVHLKSTVALKLLPAELAAKPTLLRRFYREMEAVGRLDHPNLVRARDAGEASGTHFLVMELVPGIDLRSLVIGRGVLEVCDACEIIRQAAIGLEYIRAYGLVHRDIKPSNLMLTRDGTIKILDLGLARLIDFESDTSQLTATGQIFGTFDYIAPEQVRRASDVDIRADLYSLGCTLFALLGGKPPFSDRSTYDKLVAHCSDPIPDIAERRPDLPKDLVDLLNRLVMKSPDDRFASPTELAEAIAPFAEGHDLPSLAGEAIRDTDAATIDTDYTLSRDATRDTPDRDKTVRRWSLIAILCSGIALLSLATVGVAIWIYAIRPDSEVATPPVQPANHIVPRSIEQQSIERRPRPDLDDVPPNQWYRLLEHKPIEVFWPGDGISQWFYDSEQEQVTLNSTHIGLLELGNCNLDTYMFQVEINQSRWPGGIGVFFGLHDEFIDEQSWQVYQYLTLQAFPRPGEEPEYRLRRGVERVTVDELGKRRFNTSNMVVAAVDTPQCPQVLSVEVQNLELKRVTLNGKPLPGILEVLGDILPTPQDHVGGFGVTVANSNATIRNGRFIVPGNPLGQESSELK